MGFLLSFMCRFLSLFYRSLINNSFVHGRLGNDVLPIRSNIKKRLKGGTRSAFRRNAERNAVRSVPHFSRALLKRDILKCG